MEIEDVHYRCCFCNKKILVDSPAKLNLGLYNHQYSQDFFCHPSCFRKRLAAESKEVFDNIR